MPTLPDSTSQAQPRSAFNVEPSGGCGWTAHPHCLLFLAFLIRLGVGAGLYLLAYGRDPVQPLALLNQWLATPDANSYHQQAMLVLKYLAGGQEAIRLHMTPDHLTYPFLLGCVYRLLGPHPLWGVLINCLAFGGMGWLAHRLTIRLGQPPGRALALALGVSLWPFSLAYSSTLMRESLFFLTAMGLLTGLAELMRTRSFRPRSDPWLALGLVAVFYLLTALRPELGPLVLVVSLAGILWMVLLAQRGLRRLVGVRALAAIASILTGLWLGSHASPQALAPQRVFHASSPGQAVQSTASPAVPAPAPNQRPQRNPAFAQSRSDPPHILQRRRDYAASGGLSLSAEAFTAPEDILDYLRLTAAGWRDLLLYPLPWQGPPSGGLAQRLVLTALTLLWYSCLPGVLWGLAKGMGRSWPAAGLVGIWFLAIGSAMAFVVVNLGTLFRLRDLILLPALLVFSPRPYLWLAKKTRRVSRAA